MRWILVGLGWPKALAQIIEDYASIISITDRGEYRLLVGFAGSPTYRICDRASVAVSLAQLDEHHSIVIRMLSTSIHRRIYVDHCDLEDAHRARENVREAIAWLAIN
jgi:hypothetical protein